MARECRDRPEILEMKISGTVIAVGSRRELTFNRHLLNARNEESYLTFFIFI